MLIASDVVDGTSRPCDPTGEFGDPQRIAALSTANFDSHVSLTANDTQLLYGIYVSSTTSDKKADAPIIRSALDMLGSCARAPHSADPNRANHTYGSSTWLACKPPDEVGDGVWSGLRGDVGRMLQGPTVQGWRTNRSG
jgi:hypothetical protein